MHRTGKTTPERIQYNDLRNLARTGDMVSHMQGDNGIRVPLLRIAGLRDAMHLIRDERRARGSRAHFTPHQKILIRALLNAAKAAGWTDREMARALGCTAPAVERHLRGEDA